MDVDAPVAVVELTLPADPRYLALVRLVAAATAEVVPSLSDARIADLKLVVTELFANAMEANWHRARIDEVASSGPEVDTHRPSGTARPLEAGVVVLQCRADADRVTVVVTDRGLGFDAADDVHPPVEDPERLQHERGLGIPLIQYLADSVEYDSGANGTRATAVLSDRSTIRPHS